MKRILLALCLVLPLTGTLLPAVTEAAPRTRTLDASQLELASVNAMVVDLRTGETLYARNPELVSSIASITKLMTAVVVLDAKLPLDEKLTIDHNDRDRLKNTTSRVRIGSEMSRRELLRLALMSSENRAASALGRHYPGGIHAFVKAMNKKAKALGMSSTRFVDSSGLSSENVSTAKDLVKLLKASGQYALIRDFTTTPEWTASFSKPRYVLGFNNTNPLVRSDDWNIKVSKTGYIQEAGRCLVITANVNGRELGMVFLDSLGKRSPVGDAARVRRWLETGSSGPVPAAARNYEREKNGRLRQAGVVATSGKPRG
ncbi:MAG: D-alanyl-D-alanine endopeptidase [Gammaproteobacteria bacterium]|nr:D-alanyl-D-alanine endopeptidase [Gammaproteobacteria bacterium]